MEQGGLIIIAIFIVLITAFLFFRDTGSSTSSLGAPTRQKVDGVVLIGCSGGGKTVITHQLVSGHIPQTVSSMTPSFHELKLSSGKTIQLVDFPGHERLRQSMFQHIKSAKGVILVVDPRTTKSIKQTALLVYELFRSDEVSSSIPILIFCNKNDLSEAKSHDRVKVLLQREVESMKKTGKTMGVANTSGSSSSSTGRLKDDGTPFNFDTVEGSVTFASGSATLAEQPTGLQSITSFIENC